MTLRLRRSDWIRHGLLTLARSGPDGLTAAGMSERLGVSRGSFYWHFTDIADFKAHLLDAWERQNTDAVIRGVSRRDPSEDELGSLMRRAFRARRRLDRAVRRWSWTDPSAASRIEAVDKRRQAHLEGLLRSGGLSEEVARTRALFLYWAFVGHSMTPPGRERPEALAAATREAARLMQSPT